MSDNTVFDFVAYIGRFQMPHYGHMGLFNIALNRGKRVIVVLGSSFGARTVKNPFTWQERREMILSALPEADRDRILFVPVRDYYDDDTWEKAVTSRVENLTGNGSVALVGFKKDKTSEYLMRFKSWGSIECERVNDIDATPLRRAYFSHNPDETTFNSGALSVLQSRVAPSVLQFLSAFMALPEYQLLVREARKLEAFKKDAQGPKFRVQYMTADALVRAYGKVLLIKRENDVGAGLYAIPGGFLEEDETFEQAALRELSEETNISILASELYACKSASRIFDHPGRSQRGRVVTNAFYFDLGSMRKPPEVTRNKLEGEVMWVPISDLPSMEHLFFEDHFMILDYFLNILQGQR